jgi:hypothetical protein
MENQNLKYVEIPEHFALTEVRPRFKFDLPLKPSQIVARFHQYLALKDVPCKGQADETYATLYFSKDKRHYWSPQLTLMIEEEEDGSHVRGLYGPRPAVWTMFVFFYALIGVLILFAIVIGGSQLMLHKSSWVIWAVPALLAVFVSLWFVAKKGKNKGKAEMVVMHHFLTQILGLERESEK